MWLPPLASSHFYRINNKLVGFCISYCSVQLLNVAALEQAWAAWPLLHTTACWLLMWSAVEIGVAEQKGFSQHLWLNSEQQTSARNERKCSRLGGLVSVWFCYSWECNFKFECGGAKGKRLLLAAVCWTEEEGLGLWCAGKGWALRGANGFPTVSLLGSVPAVLPACSPLFSTPPVPSMGREGSGSPWLRRSEICGMVELGVWDPGKGDENAMEESVCVWGDSKHLAGMEEACGPLWRWQGQQPERETRRVSGMVHGAWNCGEAAVRCHLELLFSE